MVSVTIFTSLGLPRRLATVNPGHDKTGRGTSAAHHSWRRLCRTCCAPGSNCSLRSQLPASRGLRSTGAFRRWERRCGPPSEPYHAERRSDHGPTCDHEGSDGDCCKGECDPPAVSGFVV